MGPFGFDAGLFESLGDAVARHLRNGGRLVPSRLELGCAPVSAPELRDLIDTWITQPAGLDLSAVRAWVVNQRYWSDASAVDVLCAPITSSRASIGDGSPADLGIDGHSEVLVAGEVHALAVWWTAQLSETATLTNSPMTPRRIDRVIGLLPIAAFTVRPGERLSVELRPTADGRAVSWRVTRQSDPSALHSTLLGELLPAEELAAFRPDARQSLGPRARAHLRVLIDADAGLTLREIEANCSDQHGGLFGSPAEVQRFVREVLSDVGR
jgi:hypothetical protein